MKKSTVDDEYPNSSKRLFVPAVETKAEITVINSKFIATCAPVFSVEEAKDFILKKPATLELVLTGRNPDPVFLEAADYVSEIHGVRHPYQKQIPARKGIEF